ncbi:hypothetical protein KKE92_02760 [Candidatus Micrarchaeota archaeon]|nr:hypothetical protein [Candidatus Micrarchaeota archaeon]
MGRKVSIILMTAGALAITAAVHVHQKEFNNESIWQRQRPLIERVSSGNQEKAQLNYQKLRTGLTALQNSSDTERCKMENRFKLTLERGDESAAQHEIMNGHFEPHSDCSLSSRLKDESTKEHGIVGLGGAFVFFLGAISFVASFRRRKLHLADES